MNVGRYSVAGWLMFRRIVDIPFETCVAALESWPPAGQDGDLHIGHSLVRRPADHDREPDTCQVQVRLARGPLRPLLLMRLDVDPWTWSPPRTALELIPCQRVRPSVTYFRAGHLLLDSLTSRLRRGLPAADREDARHDREHRDPGGQVQDRGRQRAAVGEGPEHRDGG
jgi:hypothetical protein